MRTYPLDIKESDNQFIITVDKDQLSADYILSLVNWLQFATLSPIKSEAVLLKTNSVEQKTEAKPQAKKRIWNYSGSVDLKQKLDHINLRDLAYE